MDNGLLSVREVAELLGVSPRWVWQRAAMAEAGLECRAFPRPIRLSAKLIRWRASDVATFIDALAGGTP